VKLITRTSGCKILDIVNVSFGGTQRKSIQATSLLSANQNKKHASKSARTDEAAEIRTNFPFWFLYTERELSILLPLPDGDTNTISLRSKSRTSILTLCTLLAMGPNDRTAIDLRRL
jgi:hypothetical protein